MSVSHTHKERTDRGVYCKWTARSLKEELIKRGVTFGARDSKSKLTDRLQEFLANTYSISKEMVVQFEELVPELAKTTELKSLRGELEKRLHVKSGDFDSAKVLIEDLVDETKSGNSKGKGDRRRAANRQKRPRDSTCDVASLEWDDYVDEMEKLHDEMVRNAQNFDALRERMEKSFQKAMKAGRKAVRLCDFALDRNVDEGDREDGRKSRRTRDAIDSESCDSS